MGILDIEIVKGFMRMCNDGWLQGWHERNGGNLTYRMKEEEVAQCRPFFDPQPREWVNMGVQADNLAGEYFITTGSGKFFRNVESDPVHSIGIVEINDKGDSWRIVWGLEGGAKPTSEFPSHFNAFMQVLHFLYTNTFIIDSPFPFLLIFHNILLVFHIILPTFYFFYTMPYRFCNHVFPCS